MNLFKKLLPKFTKKPLSYIDKGNILLDNNIDIIKIILSNRNYLKRISTTYVTINEYSKNLIILKTHIANKNIIIIDKQKNIRLYDFISNKDTNDLSDDIAIFLETAISILSLYNNIDNMYLKTSGNGLNIIYKEIVDIIDLLYSFLDNQKSK